ncbi:alpha/beta hydrolase [Solirubrobacter phytolaccae]|uniref:Alpha/beta hydrolase n=1 Tax=Solirubrobacter phytolaccae TaxID=1404360 RepID=A0A9X3NAS0_9ACTN|nr:alpha/beta hydrolase [Solirubrobacter phytolaccae]MDA0180581.1 alpha/beta hydrolase [Solirubrobacter phytolaccae]
MSLLPSSRVVGTVLAFAAASATLFAASAAQAAPTAKPSKPTVVLVHGAWADGSSWAGVTRALQADGYTVTAPPNPLRGLQADAAYLASYLKTVKGPIVLAGHSYGGAVITEAATGNPNVKALVFVDAFIPDTGDSVLSLLTPKDGPAPDPNALFDAVPFPGAPEGVVDWYFKPAAFPSALANDLPKREAAVLAAAQRPIAVNAFVEKTGTPAWKTIPSWAVIGTEDHILPVALQTFMATRAKAHITKVKASHLSLISQPAAVAKVIRTAAHAKR